MNCLELCRDALAKRCPGHNIFVEAEAMRIEQRNELRFAISITPGFDFSPCQRFSGATLSECLAKLETARPQPEAAPAVAA